MENKNDSPKKLNFSISIPVRYADCDMLGHVNHAKMFTYMEEARTYYLTQVFGISFSASAVDPDTSAIIAEASCTYQSPGRFGETLLVRAGVTSLGRSSFVMDYEITEQKNARPVATGKTIGVYFDYKSQKSVSIPAEIREKIEKFEQRKF